MHYSYIGVTRNFVIGGVRIEAPYGSRDYGAEIETPKASTGKDMGRGVPLPSRLGCLGSAPAWSGAETWPKTSLMHFCLKEHNLIATNSIFLTIL